MTWMYIFLIVCGLYWVDGTPSCAEDALPSNTMEWMTDTSEAVVKVEWGYGNITCNSVASCFAGSEDNRKTLVPQLIPVQIQPGVTVKFYASPNMDVNFTIQPHWVTEAEFQACNVTAGIAVIPAGTMDVFTVDAQFLRPGINYFIVQTIDPIFKCEYGLRLNITVQEERCRPPGETIMCHDRGRCVSTPTDAMYQCSCCHGYTDRYCNRNDACASSPCQNGATCTNDERDPTATQFNCECPFGYYGSTCAYHVDDLCTLRVCEHNSSCEGNATHYHCGCDAGYMGVHCEINIDECSSNPCEQGGVCYDRVNGYECFCRPGTGGEHCEETYNECESSPCINGGFCVDRAEGWMCHCGQGYTGVNCARKVDLCNPSPCFNATDCTDFGNEYECICQPGFIGPRCEININECASSPCLNSGRCYDEPAAYRCLCSPAFTGVHCETRTTPEADRPPDFAGFPVLSYPRSHLTNLAIVAGTLAGALLIALAVLAGCYCRLYGFMGIIQGEQFQYKKQNTEDPQPVPPPIPSGSHVTDAGPSADAILEAASITDFEQSLNKPLVKSLKSRRV